MRTVIVSTFPPRECGIASFTSDLHRYLNGTAGIDRVDVVAVTDGEEHDERVVATIARNDRDAYERAARLITRLDADVVVLEHEFGIFGGRDGEYVLALTQALTVPYVVALHTVLTTPTPGQAAVLTALCDGAAAVQVFTTTARRLLGAGGRFDLTKVHVIPHGAPPEVCAVASSPRAGSYAPGAATARSPGRARFVLSSFGLLSAGKGIETTIDAVAKVAPLHPAVLLVIAGRTHPEVVRRDGERYREFLEGRVAELGIGDQVHFDDRFLTVDELAALLADTDLYVTAYRSEQQIVSGALTFALGAGCPVVSTPYLYAADMLDGGAGRLVPFDDPNALAASIAQLIEQPGELAELRAAARDVGRTLAWPAIAETTTRLLRTVARRPRRCR